MKKNPRRVHYVLSSHWDREWYQTFQDYRRRLVHLLDRTLDDLDSGTLRGPFTTDGQSIILEDYLEIRPERRADIERLARDRRLSIGPWYVLPDEWLVSGESLVRNIRLGREVARRFGAEPSNAGFLCDLFGHTAQIPQILAGFGIRNGLMWRGVDPLPDAHFLWEGSDGTVLTCYRFGRSGYCDYAANVRHINNPDSHFETDRATRDLTDHLAREAGRTAIPPLLVFDGGDHLEYDQSHYELLFSRSAETESPYHIIHSSLDDYLEDMEKYASQIKTRLRGELRERAFGPLCEDQQWLIPGVLSSRVWIKQANAECETLLCHWAEPMATLAAHFIDTPFPHGFLNEAWRWLLQNHPHDSICGCSIDAVHEDMKFRFAQARQIALGQTVESLRLLASSVQGDIGEREFRLFVANPLPREASALTTITLEIPAEWATFKEFFGFENKPAFRIFSAEGTEVPYQWLTLSANRTKPYIHPLKFPSAFKTHEVTICLPLDLPALGYTTLTVREAEKSPAFLFTPPQAAPVRTPQLPGLATGPASLENAHLAVHVAADGSLTLHDKKTGATYHSLLTFEDCADIGDGWFHGPPVNDEFHSSTTSPSHVSLVHDGPYLATLRVRTTMSVPREFDYSSFTRSDTYQDLVIDSHITLRAHADHLEIRTTVRNLCKDHRLRVLFPTSVNSDTYHCDAAFDVVERKVGLPPDNHLARELAVETTPQLTWTAIADAGRGLAVVSRGLYESCVKDWPDRPIALTLFRSTRKTVFTDGEPEGQIQGDLVFDYWLVPQSEKIQPHQLFDHAARLAAGVRTVQVSARDQKRFTPTPSLPSRASLYTLTGPLVVTSTRQIDGATEIRLFNPAPTRAKATLSFTATGKTGWHPTSASLVNLESEDVKKLKLTSTGLTVTAEPKQILTIRLK